MEYVAIKDWFFNKQDWTRSKNASALNNVFDYERNLLVAVMFKIVGESEKAFKLEIDFTNNNDSFAYTKTVWCPKSCCCSFDEYLEDKVAQREKLQRYLDLVEFAKAKGLKVTDHSKAVTILKKLEAIGIEYKY